MKQYRTSLNKRRHRSARITQRYWNDPDYRLQCVNRDRARRGAPPLQSVDEIKSGWSKLPWTEKRGEA